MEYCAGASKKSGRKHRLTPFQTQYLLDLLDAHKDTSLNDLTKLFLEHFGLPHNQNNNFLSVETVRRTLKKSNITRKKLEFRHILQSEHKRRAFLNTICHVHPNRLIDIDETPASERELRRRYGYARRGQRAQASQIKIDNRHYSVIAAYSIHGFLCWNIIEGSFAAADYIHFLEAKTSKYVILYHHFAIIDNSSIHKTPQKQRLRENILLVDCLRSLPPTLQISSLLNAGLHSWKTIFAIIRLLEE